MDKKKKDTNKKYFPVIDIGRCSDCRGCVEVAPKVFQYNATMGMMEAVDMSEYPRDIVDEAIKNCPKDCIEWEYFVIRSKK